MFKKLTFFLVLLFPILIKCQTISFTDSFNRYKTNYINTHEVVTGEDRKLLQFFPADSGFRVAAIFTRDTTSEWFLMATTGKGKQQYRRYGKLSFMLKDTRIQLSVYQSKALMTIKDYSDYLFLPFTDETNGLDTYGGGRYIDLRLSDVATHTCSIDFNRAYNPYCAYAAGFECPVPPAENDVKVTITAGEKSYLKH